jgi:transglutaminase-like putative cysteine protease
MNLNLVDRELHAALADPALPAPAAPAPEPGHFEIDCRLDYQLSGPCDFIFQLHALDGIDQSVLRESLQLSPKLRPHVYADPTVGHRIMRLHAEAGPLSLRYRARVERRPRPVDPHAPEVPIRALPDEVLHNLMPTRYCESDLLGSAAFKLFGGLPPGHARVQAIADWVHDNIEYRIGSTQPTTTARDVFVQRAGVCRDFAHLAITFCRALNIPARLVVGYAIFDEPPPDFHAVFEAFIGGRWVMFDPTRMSPVEDLVRIAVGHDAKDVAFATIFGPATMDAMSPEIRRVRPRAALSPNASRNASSNAAMARRRPRR